MIPVVVDQAFLAAHPEAVLADVRWYLDGRDGRVAYEAGHLPGAVWVDLDRDLAANGRPAHEGRHPLPDAADFAAAMTRLGVGDDSVIVAYDDTGGLTAGRLVVMLRMLGRDAAMLDGGTRAWTAPLAVGWVEPRASAVPFTPTRWPIDRLASADEIAAVAASHGAAGVAIDARAAERFTGEQAVIDPRPGHIPGSRNAPWGAVLGREGRLRGIDELRAHYAALGIDGTTPVITSCGSGVSACMNIVALEHAGLGAARLYVGSWSGWASDPAREAELGPATS